MMFIRTRKCKTLVFYLHSVFSLSLSSKIEGVGALTDAPHVLIKAKHDGTKSVVVADGWPLICTLLPEVSLMFVFISSIVP